MDKKESKVETILSENARLKERLSELLMLVHENEAIQESYKVVEELFLLAESLKEIDLKALRYMQELFAVNKVILYIDEKAIFSGRKPDGEFENIIFTNAKTLRYAYVEKRPYFGTYIEGLIQEFRAIKEIGSYLIAPVIENGKIIASLNMYSSDPERISDEAHYDFVRDLTIRVSITLRKLRDKHQLMYQTQFDPYTDAYNKRMLPTAIGWYLEKLETKKEPFCFILTDLRNFRLVNDTAGHIAGDDTLKDVVAGIKKILAKGELIGRFGGDEFYIILKESEPKIIQERFNKIIFIINIIAEKLNLSDRLGISGGYVCVPQNIAIGADQDKTIAEIVKMADMALYHSRVSGVALCNPLSAQN